MTAVALERPDCIWVTLGAVMVPPILSGNTALTNA
jgi:hypothetical protein